MMPANVSDADVEILRDAIVSAATDGLVKVESPEASLKAYFQLSADSLGYGRAVETAGDADAMDADGLLSVSGTVASLSPGALSYAVTRYFYPPHAANGSTTLTYINYDFEAGRVMSLSDLFTPEGLRELPALIAERAKATFPEAEISTLPTSGSFYLDYEGRLVFVYQQGEVASRATGAVTAAFYPQELEEFLTPAGKQFLE